MHNNNAGCAFLVRSVQLLIEIGSAANFLLKIAFSTINIKIGCGSGCKDFIFPTINSTNFTKGRRLIYDQLSHPRTFLFLFLAV